MLYACAFQMLSLLEHMYTNLGFVREFNINPITLKRWLVSKILCYGAKYFCAVFLSFFNHFVGF